MANDFKALLQKKLEILNQDTTLVFEFQISDLMDKDKIAGLSATGDKIIVAGFRMENVRGNVVTVPCKFKGEDKKVRLYASQVQRMIQSLIDGTETKGTEIVDDSVLKVSTPKELARTNGTGTVQNGSLGVFSLAPFTAASSVVSTEMPAFVEE